MPSTCWEGLLWAGRSGVRVAMGVGEEGLGQACEGFLDLEKHLDTDCAPRSPPVTAGFHPRGGDLGVVFFFCR